MENATCLEQLYPDISDELENRHSSHFGDLKRRFSKTFADYEPQWFVSAKGVVGVMEVQGSRSSISMALENGTVLAAAATNLHEDVYINTEEQEEEIVLSCKGEILEGHSALADIISEAYRKGIENGVLGKLSGAIIYFDVTIDRSTRSYRESISMAVAKAAVVINGLSAEETNEDLEQRVLVPPLQRIHYNLYDNKKMLHLQSDGFLESLSLTLEGYTFLFCAIDYSEAERALLKAVHRQMELQLEVLEVLAQLLLGEYEHQYKRQECNTLRTLLNVGQLDKLAVALQPGTHTLREYQIMLNVHLPQDRYRDKEAELNLRKRLFTFVEQYKTVNSLAKQLHAKNALKESLSESLALLKSNGLVTPQAHALLGICEHNGALACTIVEDSYVMAMFEKKKMLQAFEQLRNHLYGVGADEDNPHITPSKVKKLLFSSLPSHGCGVLDPSQQIWFM